MTSSEFIAVIARVLRPAVRAAVLLSMLALSACPKSRLDSGPGTSDGAYPAAASERIGSQLDEYSALVFQKGTAVAEYDPASRGFAWQKELDEKPYPLRIEEVRIQGKNDAPGARFLATWVDKNASPNLVVLDEKLRPILIRFRSSITARLSEVALVETIEHAGPEGEHVFGSEVWDLGRGRKLADFPHLSRLDPEGKDCNLAPERIVLAGAPASAKQNEEDAGGFQERVVLYDLRAKTKLCDTIIEKETTDPLDLAAVTHKQVLLFCPLGYYDAELICVSDKGKPLWRQAVNGQVLSTNLFPFVPDLYELVAAVSPDESRYAYVAARAKAPPELRIIGLADGGALVTKNVGGAPGRFTSLKFAKDGLIADFDYGKNAWLIDLATGNDQDTVSQESPPKIRQREMPGAAGAERQLTGLESYMESLTYGPNPLLVSNFGRRTLNSSSSASGVYEFGPPALSQDIAPTERMAVIGNDGGLLAGDELNAQGWRSCGRYRIVATEAEILFFGSKGAVERRIKLEETK